MRVFSWAQRWPRPLVSQAGPCRFLEQQRARKVVQFWLAAEHYRESLAPARGVSEPAAVAAAAADAMGLYNRFFSLQADDPLGVDEGTRVTVEANICAPGPGVRLGRLCFQVDQLIIRPMG